MKFLCAKFINPSDTNYVKKLIKQQSNMERQVFDDDYEDDFEVSLIQNRFFLYLTPEMLCAERVLRRVT